MKWNPSLTVLGMANKLRLDRLWAKGKLKYYYLAKGTQRRNDPKRHSSVFIDQCLAQSFLRKLPPIVDKTKYRGAPLDNMQKVRYLKTHIAKQDIFIKFFHSVIRELCGRGGRKIIRANGNGRHQGNKGQQSKHTQELAETMTEHIEGAWV